MDLTKAHEELRDVMSRITPDIHDMEAEKGWTEIGAIVALKGLGSFGLRVSVHQEGAFLFEAVFGSMAKTRENLLLLNSFNLSSFFRAAIDEDGYLNIDCTYLGLKDEEEIPSVFTRLLNLFSDPEHIEVLKPLVDKTSYAKA